MECRLRGAKRVSPLTLESTAGAPPVSRFCRARLPLRSAYHAPFSLSPHMNTPPSPVKHPRAIPDTSPDGHRPGNSSLDCDGHPSSVFTPLGAYVPGGGVECESSPSKASGGVMGRLLTRDLAAKGLLAVLAAAVLTVPALAVDKDPPKPPEKKAEPRGKQEFPLPRRPGPQAHLPR